MDGRDRGRVMTLDVGGLDLFLKASTSANLESLLRMILPLSSFKVLQTLCVWESF